MGYLFSLISRMLIFWSLWSSPSKVEAEARQKGAELVILVSGLSLVLGAIGEYVEEHKIIPRWTKWPFIFIVVVSLIGEFFGDAGVFVFSGHLQTISDAEIAEVSGKAADANKEAGNARKEGAAANERSKTLESSNKRLGIKLAEEQQKTARLQKEVDVASLALKKHGKDIQTQGPRWLLLREATPRLIKDVMPYSGQRAELVVCGARGSQDAETMSTWGAIAELLGGDGAKWKLGNGGVSFSDRCSGAQGISVSISTGALNRTKEAANVLSDIFANVLPPDVDNGTHLQNPEFADRMLPQGFGRKDDPWIIVAKDPELILVLIGSHPQR